MNPPRVGTAAELRAELSAGTPLVSTDLDAAAVLAAAFDAAATVWWVCGPGDTAPDVDASPGRRFAVLDATEAHDEYVLDEADDHTIIVLDFASLNPFGQAADRFEMLGSGMTNRQATIRRHRR